MSYAQQSVDWHEEQKSRVTTYKPKKPEMPNNQRCSGGDDFCKSQTPPPPSGSMNESFGIQQHYPTEWIALLLAASVAFVLLTRSSR